MHFDWAETVCWMSRVKSTTPPAIHLRILPWNMEIPTHFVSKYSLFLTRINTIFCFSYAQWVLNSVNGETVHINYVRDGCNRCFIDRYTFAKVAKITPGTKKICLTDSFHLRLNYYWVTFKDRQRRKQILVLKLKEQTAWILNTLFDVLEESHGILAINDAMIISQSHVPA